MIGTQWREAAITYVDTGDDSRLRSLVREYRADEERSALIRSLNRVAWNAIVLRASRTLAAREATGYTAKSIGVYPPTGTDVRADYARLKERDDEEAVATRAFLDTHIRNPRDRYGKWLPKDKICADYGCGLAGKWSQPNPKALYNEGAPKTALFCEKHSKEAAVTYWAQALKPRFASRFAALDITYYVPSHQFKSIAWDSDWESLAEDDAADLAAHPYEEAI